MTSGEIIELGNRLGSVKWWRRDGLTIGFTSGVFDIFHSGHLDYLKKAKRLCDRLIVAINCDQWVTEHKGFGRPIIGELHRAEMVASLACVDGVFIFSEENNAANIAAIKPDFYIKGGDYEKSCLTSSNAVEAYGGQVKIIPLVHELSTTDIVERVLSRCCATETPSKSSPRPAIFLDRDGVINEDVEYLHDPEKFALLPGAYAGLGMLADAAKHRLIVTTNQCGIGLGYFTHEDFYAVNRAMLAALQGSGVFFDRIYYSHNGAGEGGGWRKPGTGMLEQACKDLSIVREGSWMIGDKDTDIACGVNFGVKTILVTQESRPDIPADYEATSLLQAASYILRDGQTPPPPDVKSHKPLTLG